MSGTLPSDNARASDFAGGRLLSDKRYLPLVGYAHHKYKQIQRDSSYGALARIAARVPLYLYDHPAMMALAPTAMTDGHVVYLCAPFLAELLRDEQEHGGENVLPVLLHELSHIAMMHTGSRHSRLRSHGVQQTLANMAEDMGINARIKEAYGHLGFGQLFMQFVPEDPKRYALMTDTQIYRELLEKMRSQAQNAQGGEGNPSNGAGQQGAGASSGAGGSSGSPVEQTGRGQGNKGNAQSQGKPTKGSGDEQPGAASDAQGSGDGSQPGDRGTEGMGDVVLSPLDLRKELEKAGLGHVADKLGLPRNEAEQKEMAQKTRSRTVNDILASVAEAKSRKGGRNAGSHVDDWLAERVEALHRQRMKLRAAFEKAAIGPAESRRLNDIHGVPPDDLAGLQWDALGLNMCPELDSVAPLQEDLPPLLVLLDTSGSMGEKELRDSLSEIAGFARELYEEYQKPTILVFADTVARGEPVELDPEALDRMAREGIKVQGRGGTDIAGVLRHAIEHWCNPEIQGRRAADCVVYFTDLCDRLPSRSELPDVIPDRITFIAPEGMVQQADIDPVSYADFIEIAAGNVLDLDLETPRLASASAG